MNREDLDRYYDLMYAVSIEKIEILRNRLSEKDRIDNLTKAIADLERVEFFLNEALGVLESEETK